MLAALLFATAVAAAPEASPTPAPVPPKPKTIRIAAPGLEAVDVDPKKAQFLNDYLSEQVGRRSEGRIQVLTQSEVAALIGLERTRSLLGCNEQSNSCLAEIANALGADGLVVGNVAKFGDVYAMTVKVLGASDGKPLFSASNTGMKEAQLVEWVKTVAIDLVARIDPGAPAVAPTSAGGGPSVEALLEPDKNSLWLAVLGVEYERRLKGPSWIGGRAAISGGKFIGQRDYSVNWQVLFMARYMPLPPASKWVWSAYTGVGIGGIIPVDDTVAPDVPFPFAATLGVEGGYQSLRLSAEVMYANKRFTFIPGLSLALTF